MATSDPSAALEHPPKKVSWFKRDVLLFNVSIGCNVKEPQFLYVRRRSMMSQRLEELTKWAIKELNDKFAPFPTYPLALGKFRSLTGAAESTSGLILHSPQAG